MSFERPRVRTDGPGGPNIKQGARIACLDCRTAKIRCSAPTDGKVPCNRCTRHGKECVFEKHRRGRKPGRVGSQPVNSGGESDSHRSGNEPSPHNAYDSSYRGKSMTENGAYRRGQEGYLTANAAFQTEDKYRSQHSHPRYQPMSSNGQPSDSSSSQDAAWSPISSHTASYNGMQASSSSQIKSISPPGTTYFDHQPAHSHSRSHSSHALLNASREAASREHYQHAYAPMHNHSSPSPHLSAHGLAPPPPPPPPPPLSPRRQGVGGLSTPYGLQLGPITPSFGLPGGGGSTGALSPSGGLGGTRLMSHTSMNTPLTMPRFNYVDHQLTPGGLIPASTLAQNGTPSKSWLDFASPKATFSPSHHSISTSLPVHISGTSTWPDGTATPSNSHHSYKRKPAGDYFSGAVISPHSNLRSLQESDHDQHSRVSSEREDAAKRRRIEESAVEEDDEKSARDAQEEQREGEEEALEKLGDDEVGGGHVEDVLSTPLSLLAHASDAAAALKEGERRDSVGSKRIGAATMGLVSPPLPKLATLSKRWFDSDRLPHLAPRLPHILHTSVAPLSIHRQDRDALPHSRTTMMAPPFGPLTRRLAPHAVTPIPAPPPSLGAIGRSRSYTTVEAVNRASATYSPSKTRAKEEDSRPAVTEEERRAEVLGEGVYVSRQKVDETHSGNLLAPSTLDYEAWEYRDGRARARKSVSGASGQGSQSDTSGKQSSVNLDQANDDKSALSSEPLTRGESSRSAGLAKEAMAAEATIAPAVVPPRRWQVLRRRRSTKAMEQDEAQDAVSDSDESELLGASHQNFFSFSIFASKMDNEADMDPVHQGIVELREVEKLFDVFFARINPLLNLLDPFLHSVNYVRNRSALLTTVIASHAARLSDTSRDAELAVTLERYWRKHLLPEALLGGYKSVELSQAFLILSLYHKPTNRLTDDRSWQYLGFAIRIATEVGVNRATQPSEGVREIEQVQRRVRNRARLWVSLYLADREQCFQTGRPWAVLEDEFITHSHLWHREDFALPEDTRLIGFLKLIRFVATYSDALKDIASQSRLRTLALAEASNPFQWKDDVKALQYCLTQALAELERWRDVWCAGSLEEFADGSLTQAVAQLLDRWQVGSKRRYFYCRLTLCTRVLQSLERIQGVEMATAEAKGNTERIQSIKEEFDVHIRELSSDAWQSCLGMIESLLEESEHHDLSAAPNQTVVATVYGALAGLRLTRSSQGKSLTGDGPDAEVTVSQCKLLTKALIKAGSTPEHRNGAALSYGVYLEGIVTLWENNVVQAEAASASPSDTPTCAMDVQVVPSDEAKEQHHPAAAEVVYIVDGAKALTSPTSLIVPMQTPGKEGVPLLQHHTVGDEVWGSSTAHLETPTLGGSLVATDPEAMDRMWDYLTTYPDPSNGFPLSLWQPHSNWIAPTNARPPNVAPTATQ